MEQPPVPPPQSQLARDLSLANSSAKIPRLFYGTAWKGDETAELVYQALKAGFRAIDTAAQPKHYQEHLVAEGVKRAIAEGIVTREDLFIQTKFTSISGQDPSSLPYDPSAPLETQIRTSISSSLANFTTSPSSPPYLDSLVLHSPLPTPTDTLSAWSVLQTFVPASIRHIGISNAHLLDLQYLTLPTPTSPAPEIAPWAVQNRFQARTSYDAPLRRWAGGREMIYQSFWTLTANPQLLRGAAVGAVAAGAGVSREVALYALVLGLGPTVVLDGTKRHMREDLEGVERVGVWAEGEGREEWEGGLRGFREMIGDGGCKEGEHELGCGCSVKVR